MSDECAVVFTAKSVERIRREGGTSSWRLDRNRARQCIYAVCTRNAFADWVEGPEAHHSAFLIGKVSDVVPSPENDARFLILFSEFALVEIPDVWKGDRNPIKYESMSQLGIDPTTLAWQEMPESQTPADSFLKPQTGTFSISIAEAKKGLAATFGVSSDAVEITIRG